MGARSVIWHGSTSTGTLSTLIAIVIEEIAEEDRLWQAKARRRQQKEISKKAKSNEEGKPVENEALPASEATSSPSTPDSEVTRTTTRKVPGAFY